MNMCLMTMQMAASEVQGLCHTQAPRVLAEWSWAAECQNQTPTVLSSTVSIR